MRRRVTLWSWSTCWKYLATPEIQKAHDEKKIEIKTKNYKKRRRKKSRLDIAYSGAHETSFSMVYFHGKYFKLIRFLMYFLFILSFFVFFFLFFISKYFMKKVSVFYFWNMNFEFSTFNFLFIMVNLLYLNLL